MKFIISPTKKMVIETDSFLAESHPLYLKEAKDILQKLKSLSYEDAKQLRRISFMTEFKQVIKDRRSIYASGNKSEHSIEEIVSSIRETQKDVPTAFNSQTSRLVILNGEANTKFWDLILEVQKNVLDEGTWDFMSPIMMGAKNGIGTVLFFEDRDAVATMPTVGARTEAYKQNNSANSQFATWLTLTEMNLGGSLQHFNVGYEQGFDKAVREMFNLPDSFELIAQMPFDSIEQAADAKEYMDTNIQVQLFK